jgi:hypothetical protein
MRRVQAGTRTGMNEPQQLERELIDDLATLEERFADEEFSSDLYRALAGRALAKEGRPGHVSLSWRRAEDIVNGVRETFGREPLVLAQTGGEGEVASTVADELGRVGWQLRPRTTSEHDDSHVSSPPDPPPPDQGERRAPVDPEDADWEERAHAEADAGGRIMPGRPGRSGATAGRDPEERARPSS